MTPEDSVPGDDGTMHLKLPPQDAPPPLPPDAGTVRLGGVPPLAAEPVEPVGYIATVMAAAEAAAAAPAPDPGLIRFGPGVPDPKTARTIAVWKGQAAPEAERPEAEGKKRRWLFWVPVLLVFLGLLGWYLFRLLAPSSLQLTAASVQVVPTAVTCNGKATVTATVATNGEAGSFRYHWLRSDGTDSGMLTETIAAGTRQVELPLVWTISGPGSFHGTATLVVPDHPSIKPSVSFDYSC